MKRSEVLKIGTGLSSEKELKEQYEKPIRQTCFPSRDAMPEFLLKQIF